MKKHLRKFVGSFVLGVGVSLFPVKEDSSVFGKCIIGDEIIGNRYFIEKTLEGNPISYIRINPDDFKIRRIEEGDILTLENIVSRNIFGVELQQGIRINIEKNPRRYF